MSSNRTPIPITIRSGIDNQFDAIYYDDSNLVTGTRAGDMLRGKNGVENVITATYGHAVVIGGDSSNIVLLSTDQNHGDGYNLVIGGIAADTIVGSAVGHDVILGGAGNDWLVSSGNASHNAFYGESGKDFIEAAANFSALYGGVDNDTVLAYGDHNMLSGGAGNDYLLGQGNFIAYYGEAGNDSVTAFGHHNQIYGGSGDDRFVVYTTMVLPGIPSQVARETTQSVASNTLTKTIAGIQMPLAA
jgi:Ca2+-binding RTX toxin-like protein